MNFKSNYRLYLLIINFIFAYFRLYKFVFLKSNVSDFLSPSYLQLILYSFVAVVSVLIAFPQLLTDMRKIKPSSDFNDMVSYLVLAMLVTFVINAVFMGVAGSGNANLASGGDLIADLFIAVIFAPLFEEITLRLAFSEIINSFFGRSDPIFVMVVNAVVFSALHLVNQSGLTPSRLVCYFLIYGVLGFTNAYAYTDKGNIWYPICIHSMWNGFIYIGNIIGNIVSKFI